MPWRRCRAEAHLALVLLLAGCGAPTRPGPVPVGAGGLHNVYRVAPWLYSGSGPEGDADHDALVALGVRTVVSVDGAKPDLRRARARGLRYVHLPIGYDGIPRARAMDLARAARDLPRPIYVHCHHGKHRGPAAVAVMGLCAGVLDRETAEAWLTLAGTDPRYAGLVTLPRTLTPPAPGEIAAPGDFPEEAVVSDLVQAMVEIDARFAHLNAAAKANRGTPPAHPDIEPAHEALLLGERYREAARAAANSELKQGLVAAAAEALALERALRAKPVAEAAGEALRAVRASCSRCHARHRDGPG